jgi:exopolysaccharide biosynthesis WecB/TagA/CpsF family protein
MQEKFRGLNICGYYEPPMDFEGDAKELKKAIRAVNLAKPDIIFVCLGMPKQEKFIYSNKDKMDFHVALPFGAAVDFAAEKSHRAPVWMRKCGLEWFYRFLQEPGRLFHRYFIEDMQIFLLAWKYRKEI